MRKKDLIKILESIHGNPEIMLWNGIVEDVMHIKNITPKLMEKTKFSYYEKGCKLEAYKDGSPEPTLDELKENYKKYASKFELVDPYFPINKKMYTYKTVYVIDAKPSGKVNYGRGGNISY